MRNGIIAGIVLIITGFLLIGVYEKFVKPESEARELMVQAKMSYERGTKDALNSSIDIFTKVIAKYPETRQSVDAYYLMAQAYEKIGLNRLAYLKYSYLLKNNSKLSSDMIREVKARIAGLKIMKQHTEEGVDQLLGLLNMSNNREFRSRVYTELGHTYLKTGELAKSKRMFDIALFENGSNEEAIIGKARTYKRMGYDDSAYDLYEYFLKYYGNFSPYTGDVRASYLIQVFKSGYNSYIKGQYSRSISYFSRLLKYFPENRKTEHALYWIGESYFEMKNYDKAAVYFSRVLSNSFYDRDEDARIKRGYTFFIYGKYDMAAREFQIYITDYPKGKHITTAKKWKEMSTKELLYRINNKTLPEDGEDGEGEPEKEPLKKEQKPEKTESEKEEDVKSGAVMMKDNESELENVAEL